jgi:phosphoribosyl 1,2-cyclic phosphodiesterase
MTYRVTIWGARGSIPTPGPQTARYGGNTPCVVVEAGEAGRQHYVVLDAGTGIRPFGRAAAEGAPGPVTVDLLLSHTHWDHIQGLPFFAPLFDRQNTVRIWGPRQGDVDLERILREQMSPVVFPVPLDKLDAALSVTHVAAGTFDVGEFTVGALRLRHPGTTLAYRLAPQAGGPGMAYVTDNELGPGGTYDVEPGWYDDLVAFVEGADVLIHDAMFTAGEIARFGGWGHSTAAEAVRLATDGAVKRLVLFHHRPERDDAGMDGLVAEARRLAARAPRTLDVVAATEGLRLDL